MWGLRLDPLLSARTPPSIARMCTTYRTLQCTILGISSTVRMEILAAVSTRPPLDILIRKLVWRYYHHITTTTPPRLVTTLSTWTTSLDDERHSSAYGFTQGYIYLEHYSGPTAIYREYCAQAAQSLAESRCLSTPSLAALWIDVLRVGLSPSYPALQLLDGYRWPEFRALCRTAICHQDSADV